MRRILISLGCYLPGFQAGGPIRSVANLVQALGDEFDFRILTADRDLGSSTPYPNIRLGVWQPVGKAQVMYLAPAQRNLIAWRHHLNALDYDVLYLNSFFAPETTYTLLWRRLSQLTHMPVIIAPRGEFSLGALAIKAYKKRPYVWLLQMCGLTRDITWHASSLLEADDTRRQFASAQIQVAPNDWARPVEKGNGFTPRTKHAGEIRLVFLSRLARKKNLDFALRVANKLTGQITFDIYGPTEDRAYWAECQRLIVEMPSNICVHYGGAVEPDRIGEILARYHLFFLPTRGENYGHVIAEALMVGCPVLISDQTPWRELAMQHAGWDVPLADIAQFQSVLQNCIDMDQVEYDRWSRGAREYAMRTAPSLDKVRSAYRCLFCFDR